jgi:hypothetical protein
LSGAVGLRQKSTTVGQVVTIKGDTAGSGNELDGRPAISDRGSKFEAIHTAGHLDVGKYDGDVSPGFENSDGFVGIGRFNHIELISRNHLRRVHPDKHVIFDNKDDRSFRC